jgi:tight adherence protein B
VTQAITVGLTVLWILVSIRAGIRGRARWRVMEACRRGRSAGAPGRMAWRHWMPRMRSPVSAARYRTMLAPALDEIARGLRSGASLFTALGDAAAAGSGLVAADLRTVTVVAAGRGLVPALRDWTDRRPFHDVGLVVAALALSADTGGAQAATVSFLADGLHQRIALGAELHASSAQARLSAAVIAAAPAGFAVVLLAVAPDAVHFLIGTVAGRLMAAAGLLLDAAGGWWMHRLTEALQ